MSRINQLNNYIQGQPALGQIVYRSGAHAVSSGKVVELLDPVTRIFQAGSAYEQRYVEYPVKVRWLNGKETVERGGLRDSEKDVTDRLRFYETGRAAVERAKLL